MRFHGAISALLLVASHYTCACPTQIDEREAAAHLSPILKGRDVTINTYDYVPTNGPLTWHKTPGNGLCKSGTRQSPILLGNEIHQTGVGAVQFSAPNAAGKLEHKGTGIEVKEVKGTLKYAARTYELDNFHFHTPSEHRIHKEHYPVEMHMVHRDTNGNNTLVLGFVIQLSTKQYSSLPHVALAKVGQISPGQHVMTTTLQFDEIAYYTSHQRFYSYGGSLTTPPCTQDIQWLVGTEPLHMDVGTYNALKHAVKYNSRIIQNSPGSTNVIQLAC
ncbi:hypothetical protein EPUS_01287 [Endocarpon pusillum Z07020]|uniref:Carbonic anhydrase n=1 Tax=Endocarpon pusillum (strain Z07020 / HMAS-L-300199) TaxID=1263415 RepID=U1GV44_ENDPU|nr:uncharacterized protein EPUS_01287 [Endocarpon pusillum Z07020]ERF75921.1 hypothetical protein EPUS_01287 [Endocarpon pusillum Z07020]